MNVNIELLKKIDRIHPYPAKFPVDTALHYIEKYTSQGDVVFDPFVGSGTTLLASSVLNRSGFGTDINYIAILISTFKLLCLNNSDINDLKAFISTFQETYQECLNSVHLFNYPSIEHWFCKEAIIMLSLIKERIAQVKSEQQQLFCNLVFSSIINTVSNQEGDTRYAAIKKDYITIKYIAETFIKKFNYTLALFIDFCESERKLDNKAIFCDAKHCDKLASPESVDLILTSPPYPNTYDYYLYHKHRMNWLGFDVQTSMKAEIGSRREYSSLKLPKEKFNEDLYQIFNACNSLLKVGGKVVIVMGDGRIQGEKYDAEYNIKNITARLNWHLIDYSFSNLDETSRSFQQSYRTKGKKEHVLVLQKEKNNEN